MQTDQSFKELVKNSPELPAFLYGTAWKESETQRCVEDALAAGFRAIDTANQRRHYFEVGVGEAIKKFLSLGKVSRKDIFIQTKFTSIGGQDERLPYEATAPVDTQVNQSFESSLEHLHTDYIDSYVLHGPSSYRGLTPEDWEIWRAMEVICQAGKTKRLGASNVNLDQLRSLVEGAKIKPSFVQNRCFARTAWDKEVRAYCTTNGITYQGFSLLTANQEIFHNPRFIQLVKHLGCTPAQAVFCFASRIGMLPITGTTDPVHMSQDLKSLSFEMTQEDVQIIERISI